VYQRSITWLIPFLEKLAGFLNHDFNRGEWNGPFGFSANQDLQTELRSLLDPVITNGKGFRESLSALLGRLADLRTQARVRVRPANKKAMRVEQAFRDDLKERARQGDIELMGNDGEIKQVSSAQSLLKLDGMRWAIDVEPWPTDASSYLLWIVDAALREGELSRLRVCRYCSRYFAAKNRSAKRISCSDQCRVEYWNQRHLESGYHNKIRMRKRKRIEHGGNRAKTNPQPRKE
jgi:hypothetical protein